MQTMTNKLPTSPATIPQSKISLPPAIQDVLKNTQELAGFLTEPNRKNLEERNRKIAELIEELEVKVRERSEEIGYGYEFDDYEKRLTIVSDDALKKILNERVLNHNSIKQIYEEILGLINNKKSKDSLRKKLFKDYFEALTYESIEKKDYMYYDSTTWQYYDYNLSWTWCFLSLNCWPCDHTKKNLSDYIKQLQRAKHVSLNGGTLENLNIEDLNIFWNLQNVKSIDLWNNALHKLSEKSLKTIFSNLQNVKNIDFTNTTLALCEKNQLIEIFRHLKNINNINLSFSWLHLFNKENLHIVFSSLKNIKNINLNYEDLWSLDKDLINCSPNFISHV